MRLRPPFLRLSGPLRRAGGCLAALALICAAPAAASAQIASSEELARALWQPLDLSTLRAGESAPASVAAGDSLDAPVQAVSGGRVVGTVLATGAGGVAGAFAGALVGLGPGDDDYLFGGLVGWLAGTTVGSAIGASAGNPDASFGEKLGRSTLTLGIGIGAAFLANAMAEEAGAEDDAGFGVATLVIPVGQILAVLF